MDALYAQPANTSIKRLQNQHGVLVRVYSLKRKPEIMTLMSPPDLFVIQCVRSLSNLPEITGELL
jgi:hypothetical protein